MGNICGKQSHDDNFSTPGRTLGSAPPQQSRASIPAKVSSSGPGRTLGGGGTGLGQNSGRGDPKTAAARAAEERAAKQNQPKGKLGTQLDQQKKQTRVDTLQQASNDARRQRDSDAHEEARNYN